VNTPVSIITPAPLPAGVPAPASTGDALAMARAGLSYLAAADPTTLTAPELAETLQELERLSAISTAARAWFLGAFTAAQGHAADADRSPRTWLVRKTGVTEGAAAGHVGWSRRVAAHPDVAIALAAGGRLTESLAKVICQYTDKLPMQCRAQADQILLGAAEAGMGQDDIARLAAEMYERSRSGQPDDDGPDGDPGGDQDDGFEDRGLTLATTFRGAGVLTGDLTPECAALAGTVLESLGRRAGPEDTRTHEQRLHDALEEALRRLLAAGLVPDRAGQPAKMIVHTPLGELRAMDAGSALEQEWAVLMTGQWAGQRAAASVAGADGAAWLGGEAARGIACDAGLVPVVTGHADLSVLDRLVALCVELAGRPQHCCCHPAGPQAQTQLPGTEPADAGTSQSGTPHSGAPGGPLTANAREMLQRAIIGAAADLLSGPGGLASYLRIRQLGGGLAGPSLPLDVGVTGTVPPAIRHALVVRSGGHCEWPGGCDQPAGAYHVHHLTPRADGGKTTVKDCGLFCSFHHLVAVHRWGWTLTLNPDGTTTARSPDGSKTLRSHGPPPLPG
jgi:Domain of unknown function (DUF222)